MKIDRLTVGFLSTNCYIVSDGENAVVIDPGADAEGILQKLSDEKLRLSAIFLTHAHFDHTLAVKKIKDETGAPIYAAAGEKERLRDAEISGHTMLRRREFVPLSADEEFFDGMKLTFGEMDFEIILTPGHTEGSVCIITEDAMFSGDTLFEGTCGRCDLQGGSFPEMLKSLKRLYNIERDYDVYPGHGEKTTLSREKMYNPYMAEAVKQ